MKYGVRDGGAVLGLPELWADIRLDYDELEDRYDIQIGAGASKVTIRT
jgi:hypothetical protein